MKYIKKFNQLSYYQDFKDNMGGGILTPIFV